MENKKQYPNYDVWMKDLNELVEFTKKLIADEQSISPSEAQLTASDVEIVKEEFKLSHSKFPPALYDALYKEAGI